ncbi:MAG: flavodoxin family protein [Methanobrevibacter sp.]|uniref:flavodoxin family protein n=1 Tax=Methanobrevibacter sp. TaxID=66852 RepID=UPI003F0F70C4
MATLIIYYSLSGKTELVAHTLAKKINANVLKIKDLKSRKGFKNKFLASISAFRESKTDITPAKVDLTDYDTIIFGTPTWSGNPTPAILTIIDRCNLTGKDVILFATMDNSHGEANIKRLEEKVKMRGARVIESFTIATKDKPSEILIRDTETIVEIKDLKMYTR